jgi:pyruvate/2-oxoglutarate dehydrogenase complex dihydrolipoamide dehydrogenase (E3) component
MASQQFDVLVIGAGPAGTLAALRAGELGAKTALVTRSAFGGMAANEGPIPVRTLAHAARLVREARQLPQYGIAVGAPRIDYESLVARAREVVSQARSHSTLFEQVQRAGVALFERAGTASFADAHTIQCDRGPTFQAERVVICSGGVSRRFDVPGGELTVTPEDAFGLADVPDSLLVIGAGATGVQVASIFSALGSRVILCQTGPRIIASEDSDVSAEVARAFREDGMTVYEDTGPIARFDAVRGGVRTSWQNGRAPVETQYVVAAIGWVADTDDLHLGAAGATTNRRGFIEVDDFLRTSAGHVYAAGDVIGRSMLVPQAVTEGFIAGTNAAGGELIAMVRGVEPIGSFTDPEYAKVGLTEHEARQKHDVLISSATYDTTTRPIIDGRTRGFCKLVIDRNAQTLLGCHIVGERAVEVAQMAAIAMSASMKVRDLARIPLSFPTYANVLGRAAIRAARELGDKSAVET